MRFLGVIFGVLFIIMAWVPLYAQDKPESQENIVSLEGRLKLEPREKGERLVLYGKDRKVYIIYGEFEELLKSSLLDLGEDNLVSVSGIPRKEYDTVCKTKYGFGPQGERTLDTQCIRYYYLKVTQINEAKKSDEEIPPPERDVKEEEKARKSALDRIYRKSITDLTIRSIEGKITSLNLRSPIKTVKIRSQIKKERFRDKVLLLTSNSRLAKKIVGTEEPMFLDFNSLRVGQRVYIEYIEDEYKPEALFITITKE